MVISLKGYEQMREDVLMRRQNDGLTRIRILLLEVIVAIYRCLVL